MYNLLQKLKHLRYAYNHPRRQDNPADPINGIPDPQFWDVDYRFLTDKINSERLFLPTYSGLSDTKALSTSNLATNKCRPNIWLSTAGLVKSSYSTIMTNLS